MTLLGAASVCLLPSLRTAPCACSTCGAHTAPPLPRPALSGLLRVGPCALTRGMLPCGRDKEHSTIIYESPPPHQPLLRLGWNKQDPRYMATLLLDCSKVVVLDIRCALLCRPCDSLTAVGLLRLCGPNAPRQVVVHPQPTAAAPCRFPTLPVAELQRHTAPVNALAWAPHSSCHICTAGDDAQALIWDLSAMNQPVDQELGAPCHACLRRALQAHRARLCPTWLQGTPRATPA